MEFSIEVLSWNATVFVRCGIYICICLCACVCVAFRISVLTGNQLKLCCNVKLSLPWSSRILVRFFTFEPKQFLWFSNFIMLSNNWTLTYWFVTANYSRLFVIELNTSFVPHLNRVSFLIELFHWNRAIFQNGNNLAY